MFPYLGAITEGNWVGIFAYGVLMHGALYSMANGVWPAFYAEMFPTRVRVTGLALGTQIGFAISGGVAPAVATSLAGADLHNAVLPAVFTVAMCALVALGALTAREGYKKSLAELDA
jgi:metabolite transporter, MFS family